MTPFFILITWFVLSLFFVAGDRMLRVLDWAITWPRVLLLCLVLGPLGWLLMVGAIFWTLVCAIWEAVESDEPDYDEV